jgi:hypothetical protein
MDFYNICKSIVEANDKETKDFYLDKDTMNKILNASRNKFSDVKFCFVHDEPFDILRHNSEENEEEIFNFVCVWICENFSETECDKITNTFTVNYDYEDLLKLNQDFVVHNTPW